MIVLPRLRNSDGKEGSNGIALQVNDFGIAAGTAENGELDSTCPGASVSAQRIEFKPVIWTRPFPWSEVHVLWQQGHITDLGTLKGDSYSHGTAIGNNGLVLGVSIDANFNPRAVAQWNADRHEYSRACGLHVNPAVRMLHQRQRRDHRIRGFEEQSQ